MRKTFIPLLILLSMGVIISFSCQKEISCENCNENNNKLPIAIAGSDQVITLPTDSTLLDGRSSSDPDGRISSYLWTKVSGPAFFNIIKPSDSTTKVRALIAGIYQFELKVTDNGGLSAKDTMKVIVSDPGQPNRPPVANAGVDQTITLPNNTITLNGSGSTDPDNNITSYAWTKISGPSSFTISNATSIQTQVTNLGQGIYRVELKVTDAGGLFSKDTMQVTVNVAQPGPCAANRPLIVAQLIPFGTLSTSRTGMTIASAGNKILFAGGDEGGGYGSTRVDIYDMVTQTWSIAELSIIRWNMPVVTHGNKIFFAGGHTNDQASWDLFATVDIYDASTNTWSTAQLSERRMDLATAVVGNKILFAGGVGGSPMPSFVSNKVDIYDISSNTWSTATLSEARACMTAVAAGNKIYFAGGNTMPVGSYGLSCNATNRIDIYDNATGSWSISSMSIPLAFRAGIAVDNKIFLAGGESFTCTVPYSHNLSSNVEIIDINSQNSSFDCLFQPNSWPGIAHGNKQNNVVVKDNKIVFVTGENSGDKFDIYDVTSNTWSIGSPIWNGPGHSVAIISINNIIYVANWGEVWKLEF